MSEQKAVDMQAQEQAIEVILDLADLETRSEEAKAGEKPEAKPTEKPEAKAGEKGQVAEPLPERPMEGRSEGVTMPELDDGKVTVPPVEAPQVPPNGIQMRASPQPFDRDEWLAALFLSALEPVKRGFIVPEEKRRLDRILSMRGLSMRALGLDTTGAVFYEEIAREFLVKPTPAAIGRNHWRPLPMRNIYKATFPTLDANGITTQWGRAKTGGSLTESDPSLGSFQAKVDSLEAFVPVRDDYLLFNPAGIRFTQQYLIPAIREQIQKEEDRAFFLSTGASPWSDEWVGLKNASGVTVVAPSTDGDRITLALLSEMIAAMPPEFAQDPRDLAFYLAWERALDVQDILGQRQTGLGDYYLGAIRQDPSLIPPGPRPLAFYKGIPVYGVPWLPTDETQGTSNDCSTGFLVKRSVLAVADGGTLRIEPLRRAGFETLLQLQEWVGLAYAAWKTAIVRRPGIRPAA